MQSTPVVALARTEPRRDETIHVVSCGTIPTDDNNGDIINLYYLVSFVAVAIIVIVAVFVLVAVIVLIGRLLYHSIYFFPLNLPRIV